MTSALLVTSASASKDGMCQGRSRPRGRDGDKDVLLLRQESSASLGLSVEQGFKTRVADRHPLGNSAMAI